MKQLNERILNEVQSMEWTYGSIDEAPNDCRQLKVTRGLIGEHRGKGRPSFKGKALTPREIGIVEEYKDTQETIYHLATKYHHGQTTIKRFIKQFDDEFEPHPLVQGKGENEN